MLESVVSTLLNKVLGAYVSNLNYNQLQIGIWSGEVVLRNLRLKREALDKLNLPVDVLHGYLGELTLTIPWSNLKGKPVMININDVYVLAVPRNESTMTADEIKARQHEAKMRKLADAEMIHQPVEHTNAAEDAKNETFANQLMQKILNNLQFSITNIHIRYEDEVSAPGHRFAAGITLNELSAISTDENWIPQTIGDAVNTIHKLATLESLSVYWNTDTYSLSHLKDDESFTRFRSLIATKTHVPPEHQYILKPVCGTGRVKLNKKFGGETPKVDSTLLFDELSFVIDDEQYRDAILMIDLFHSYLKKQKYQKLHPPSTVTPRTDPRAYFQFAANAVLSEIHERNQRWTWAHIKQRRQDRLDYIDCYVADKLGQPTPEQKQKLGELEHKLSYEDIRLYRGRSKAHLRREKERLAAEEERKRKAAAAQAANSKGWLGSWWSTPNTANQQEEDEDLVITEEQKQEFYDAIEYDEDMAAVVESIEFPKDTMLLCLRTTLNKGSFTLKREPHANNPLELVSLVFDTVMLGAIQYVDSFKITAALGDLILYDGATKNTQYKKLIGVKQKEPKDRRKSQLDKHLIKFENMKNPFFSLAIEHKPLDGRADNAMALVMRNIDIVYNPITISAVIEFFRPPETSADSVNALIEVAGDTLEDIKNQTRASLAFALERHTTLDLRVDMDAPVIIIPENCSLKNCRGIVVDAGHINIESNLAPAGAFNEMKSKKSAEYTTEDYVQLRSFMYDKFTIQLTQTKILVGDSVDTCLAQVREPTKEYNHLHLVDRIDMTFLLEMCIVAKSNDLTRFKMSGHLPLLSVNFSDTKYRILMQLPRLIEASGILGNDKPDHLESDEEDSDELWSVAETAETEATQLKQKTSKETHVNQKIFELDFKVDKVSANVLMARRQREEGSTFEDLLCEVTLEHLSVEYCMRPFDMSIGLSLESLNVVDRMAHGNEFKYLVTSDNMVVPSSDSKSKSEPTELVHVEYIRVDKESPEYRNKYKGIEQTANVTLSTLNFIVTQSSVLTLYSFVLDTFVEDESPTRTQDRRVSRQQDKRLSVSKDADQRRRSSAVPPKDSTPPQPSNIYVHLLLDSVNFILNDDGVRLATGRLSHGDMSVLMIQNTVKLSAKFDNFTLTDDLNDTSEGSKNTHQTDLLTIQGEELIDLRFESFIENGPQIYPGYDQLLYLRMGSAQFTFLEQPITRFMSYFSKFAEMKLMFDRARQAAYESAQHLQQAVTKMHFDVVIKTPVVFFPEMHNHPMDVVVAHLGEIWASNTFVDEEDGCINAIRAGLRAINVTSTFHAIHPSTKKIQVQELPIVENTNLTLDIKSPQQINTLRPDMDISGKLSDLSMRLTEVQYIFLMDAVNMISRIFSGTEEPDSSSKTHPNQSNLLTQEDQLQATTDENTNINSRTNVSSDVDEENHEEPPRIRMDLDAQTIALELFTNKDVNNWTQPPDSLLKVAMNGSRVQVEMLKTGCIKTDLKVKSLVVNDSRPNINSKYKEIMPAIENGYQFEMLLDLSPADPVRRGVAIMTINDPKVIISLDHAFVLQNFAMLPFTQNHNPASSHQSSAKHTEEFLSGLAENLAAEPVVEQGIELSYSLNVVRAEFVLLANPDTIESEAVVLSAEQVMISRQAVTALVVRQMGMFLCRMDKRNVSTLKFIQTFDVSISMNIDTKGPEGQPKTDLQVDVDALVLRLSYRDAMLITDIFNKAYALYEKSVGSQPPALSGTSPAQTTVSTNNTPHAHELPRFMEAKESLRASFQGMQVILIDEIHEMPMVDMTLKPFSVDVANWSRSLSATVELATYINYFNIKNSHWEPLVEPWNVQLAISRNNMLPNDPLHVELLSDNILNLNVTHTFLESAMATMHLWDKRSYNGYHGERGAVAPYRIANHTGYKVHVWSTKVGDKKDTVIKSLENGQEMEWWFEDWRKRRETTSSGNKNLLNVQLEGALWESLRDISVDTEGEKMQPLQPMINDVEHHIMFDIKLVNNVKVVTIRSTMVIENKTLLPVDFVLLDKSGNPCSHIKKIAPGQDYAIPIEAAYNDRFCVRPDAGFGYKWADKMLHWTDFVRPGEKPSTIQCLGEGEDMPPFMFQIHSRFDKNNQLFGHYPVMSIRLSAPVEIENLLPFDFNFRIIDKTAKQDFGSFLRKGGVAPLHVIKNKHLLILNIAILDSNYNPSDFAIISTRGTEDLNIEDTLQLKSKDNVLLTLKINTMDIPDSGGARKYSIYCPYIVINKTGCPIGFKPKLAWQSSMFSGAQNTAVCRPGVKPEPFMFSYPKIDNRNRCLIQISGSEWSIPISFEAVGTMYDVTVPSPSKTEEIHVGVSVQEGQGKYKISKVITFTPRFILSNQMDEFIRYREPESRVDQDLEPNQRIPLYNLRRNAEKQLSIKLPGINNRWSAPFNIQDIGKMHVRLDSADGSTAMLMRVTTILQDATVFIVLSKEDSKNWPFRIVNETDDTMTFYQEELSIMRDDFSDNRMHQQSARRYRLPPHQSVPYSWDMPANKDKKIILNIYGRERSINLQEIGSQLPFRYTTREGKPAIASIDIKISDMVQYVYLKPFVQSESLFRPTSQGSNSSVTSLSPSTSTSTSFKDTNVREGFEAVEMNLILNLIFKIEIKQIGLSFINRRLDEIAYITLRGLNVSFKDSNVYQSLRWSIKWIQIDNQLPGSAFPILLYPTNVTREGNHEILPTLQLAVDRVKDDSHGVLYIKYFSVLLQKMSVEMDEAFVYSILDFSHINVEGWNSVVDDGKLWEYTNEIPDVNLEDGVAQLYFEMLSIQPIRFDLSFLRTDQLNIVDERPQGNSPLMFFVNILTMAIGNINAAPMKFNALAVENLRASGSDLSNRIFIHYSDQFIYQIHNVLGSADFLGNPVGLFNNLSSGVAELFYEPWQGFIMSDRPQDLGLGIARGFSGFVRKSVFGVTDSFTKFTGSIGKGLSVATMDRQYQDKRRQNMARNKPRHALVGVAQGANYFANSIASGMTGLVTRPIEGASKEGVSGFFTGFGKGLVGAVTKPVVGAFDLASNVTEGIRNSATPTDVNDIERIRYPRYIGNDGILKPYSTKEAQGQHWLREVDNGKYFQDSYIYHCHVQSDERVAMLTSNRVMLLRTRRLMVEWQEPFTEIDTIKCQSTGIAIKLVNDKWEPFLVIPDKKTRELLFRKIEEAVLKYNNVRRPGH
ncbi:hypothetical protein PHYBLDRAFT_57710 [Phycomyces blakesleeanus NRRL 1555(-)]|uniref:Vacuolar protein sorting-associated protein n=1 Tax=Phycomyces blakesleeanus (strain ATCC 8743b / DSM 1359 / FGSC 10004 / NBRC 33097 / NRRL 1555) TaxID=763407 RepID=A0A167KG88_PHYB8|nr:hypothetical protein PHYBLDRAFT_57710 [Phycomyces blakesleeanus NRRL 1555(-)]OAD68026.1 hypothetical protein PHYBLDRAFT_57710 [Phycomyces blakesleeanus NRRL 1555(-)]|eukprot:XP_018286066.1 hypothetical protein PHYBLDRAFT_57710 [Phycomyces blakesleeanus NRRL 1555(-)]